MQTLQTSRLVMRPLIAGDVPALHEFWNDPEVRRYLWGNQELST